MLFLPSSSLFFMVHLVVRHFSFTAAAAPSVSAILSAIGGCFPIGGENSAPHPSYNNASLLVGSLRVPRLYGTPTVNPFTS